MAPLQETKKRETRKANFLKKILNGDESAKTTSFPKRKPTLKKKAMELQTLCDTEVTLICYDAKGNVDFWPENGSEVSKRCCNYLQLKANEKKEWDYSQLVQTKKKKFVKKMEKKGKIDVDSLLSALSNCVSDRDSVTKLENKIKGLKQRIEFLRGIEKVAIDLRQDLSRNSEFQRGTSSIDQNNYVNYCGQESSFHGEGLITMGETKGWFIGNNGTGLVGENSGKNDIMGWGFGGQQVNYVDQQNMNMSMIGMGRENRLPMIDYNNNSVIEGECIVPEPCFPLKWQEEVGAVVEDLNPHSMIQLGMIQYGMGGQCWCNNCLIPSGCDFSSL